MASDRIKPTLMTIPLELRHHIFKHVATRKANPKKLLRYWFEKKEVKEKTAALAAQNINTTPQVVYAGDQFDDDDESEDEDYEEDEDEGEEDTEGEGDSNEDGDEEGDEDADQDEEDQEEVDGQDADEDEDGIEDEDVEMEDTDSNAALPTVLPILNSHPPAQTQHYPIAAAPVLVPTIAVQPTPGADHNASTSTALANAPAQAPPAAITGSTSSLQTHDQNTEGEDADVEMDEDVDDIGSSSNDEMADEKEEDDENEDDEDDEDEDEDNEDEDEGEPDDDDEEADTEAAPPAPVITAHSKWRHIPEFLWITHCPPPVELLTASKQLNAEAKSWFYDVAVLRINATGSFAHTSFFEEAFSQITETAFSPMEDIRKVQIGFVWDTTWLRSEQAGCAAAIFPALLRQRANFVVGILAQAPSLSEVNIHWHDSAQDDEAMDLMDDVLMPFLNLNAAVTVKTHYISTDAKPHRKSVAGVQRVRFQQIVDAGLSCLF
ncbi:hypothetical protein OPT61_g6646 [Boeremia exigua]|uniref:Uncharacterized protein n=1 Tax=Boeremia exigua TaxID=749465 RepID=A0ACC2I657_9PLEO|nr:hypothetical protein OPT61_g6646 [Boeremia exigua]